MDNLLTFEKFLFEMAKKGFLDGYKTYDTSKGYGNADEWRSAFDYRMGREEAMGILGERSPYDILGISEDADKYEIKKAWRALVLKYHPDRNPGVDTSALFREVQAAYEMLRED